MSNNIVVHLETIVIDDSTNVLNGYVFYMDKSTGEMFSNVINYVNFFSKRSREAVIKQLAKVRKNQDKGCNQKIIARLETTTDKGLHTAKGCNQPLESTKVVILNAPQKEYYIQTKGGAQKINPITEKEFCSLITIDNPELAAMMMIAGVRLFHHDLAKYNHGRTKMSKNYAECDLQNLLIFLAAHTNKNIKVEQAVKQKHSYRRFDVVDLSCPSLHRIYELKKGKLTRQQIEQKIRLFSADGSYVGGYFEAACNKYRDEKIIELIFVSNDGLTSSAEALLAEYVDSKGFIKYQYLPFLLSAGNANRRIKIKYQSFSDLTQPLIDKIYEEYYQEGGLTALGHFEQSIDRFMLGDVAIKPTKNYKLLA